MDACHPIVNFVATAYAKVFRVSLYENNPTTQSPSTRGGTKEITLPTRVTSSPRLPGINPQLSTKAARP